jgi:hypothetical protein
MGVPLEGDLPCKQILAGPIPVSSTMLVYPNR